MQVPNNLTAVQVHKYAEGRGSRRFGKIQDPRQVRGSQIDSQTNGHLLQGAFSDAPRGDLTFGGDRIGTTGRSTSEVQQRSKHVCSAAMGIDHSSMSKIPLPVSVESPLTSCSFVGQLNSTKPAGGTNEPSGRSMSLSA